MDACMPCKPWKCTKQQQLNTFDAFSILRTTTKITLLGRLEYDNDVGPRELAFPVIKRSANKL
jgi:hypothetical protein